MRKFALLAASSAGTLFSIVVAAPNQVEAMTFSGVPGARSVLATVDDAAKP
jgi:hypothetical protein